MSRGGCVAIVEKGLRLHAEVVQDVAARGSRPRSGEPRVKLLRLRYGQQGAAGALEAPGVCVANSNMSFLPFSATRIWPPQTLALAQIVRDAELQLSDMIEMTAKQGRPVHGGRSTTVYNAFQIWMIARLEDEPKDLIALESTSKSMRPRKHL